MKRPTPFNIRAFQRFLGDAADQYEKSAPYVYQWVNDAYERASNGSITVYEVNQLLALCENDIWEQANYASNRCYKVFDVMGRDTVGMAGF